MVSTASHFIPASDAIGWSAHLIAFAILLQTIEFIPIRPLFREQTGIWRWSIIRDEFNSFPKVIRWGLDRLLGFHGFVMLLWLRFFAAGAVVVFPWSKIPAAFPFFLLLSTLLICLRWRGTFNGGSDYMTVILTSALSAAQLAPENLKLTQACLWYIAIQCCFSYFFAGWAKLKQSDWRSGQILTYLADLPAYGTPERLKLLLNRFGLVLSWSLILFECSFPLSLVDSRACLAFIPLAICFHLGNVYAFGLNRFLFAWAAAYPALLYCTRSC